MAESLPVGIRFSPTDAEILVYLESLILMEDDDDQNHLRKDNVYYGFIRRATLYDTKPWELFKDDDHGQEDGNDLYFLTPLKKKFQNGSRNARTVKTMTLSSSGEEETIVGTWKFQTGPTYIVDYNTRKPLGVKRQATFVPNMTVNNQDQDAAGTSSSGCSSKKRKHIPEEMEGIRYIMHEYCLNPSDDQVYSLCRIRKIDKKKKKIIINKKKMRILSSPTTNITTTGTVVPQAVQEERAAGYDHHQQENNNICYNDGQQQVAVLPPEGVKIISDAAEVIEFWRVELNEDFSSRLEQDAAAAAAAATGGDLLYYGNDHHQEVMNNAAGVSEINIHPHGQQQQQQMAGYEHNNQYHHQEVMNNAGPVSESNIHPHVQISSDDDKKSTQEIEEDLEIPAEEWRRGATAEELGIIHSVV